MTELDDALDDALDDLAPRVLRYCLGRLSDAGDAEEVAQEALTALVQRWRRGGPPDDPVAFVFAIARRRAARRRWRRSLLAPVEVLQERETPEPDPEERAIDEARRRQLHRALRRLPAAEREAMLLLLAAELDYRSAALALGTTEAAVKMRLHRARRRLSGWMSAEECHGAT